MSKTSPLFLDGHLAGLTSLTRLAPATTDFFEFVRSTIVFLRGCGFRSVRYYECATNRPRNDEVLILADQSSDWRVMPIGYSIQYKTSTIGKSSDHLTPAVSSSADENERWMGDLNLTQNSSWIDIPVRASGRLIGLVAADWQGRKDLLSDSDIGVLATIGTLIASASESASNAEVVKVEKAFVTSLYDKSETVEDALRVAIHEFVSAMHFGAVAVFQKSRGGSKLRKVLEEVHPSLKTKITPFAEEYEIGSFLTGIAWERNENRHIVDFASLVQRRGHEVEQKSFDRHTALLGDIKSILYSKIEGREPEFMIRIMNSIESELPIVAAQRKVVDTATKAIGAHIDDVIAKTRIRQITEIAKIASKNITKPQEVVLHARDALRVERFEDLLVIASRHDQPFGTVFSDLPRDFKGVHVDRLDWTKGSLAQLMAVPGGHLTVYHASFFNFGEGVNLQVELERKQYVSIIVKTFESKTIRGFLAIPSRESIKQGRVSKVGHSIGDVSHLIETYAAVVLSSIDGYDSHVTAEGSRKFMGSIGHEVRAPALDSVQASILAIAHAERVLAHLPTAEAVSLRTTLDEALQTVNRKATEIDRMMELAKLAALQEVGNTQFNFQTQDVRTLLLEVIENLRQQGELESIDKTGTPRACTVVMNRSMANIGAIVGDAMFLKVVFSHLLRNAAKYSLPRFQGKQIEIGVVARPEPQMIILEFSNWGVGIDQAEFDTIFRPHKRGTAHDKRKAIGGLGLGLHVTRMLVSAHKGVVFCHHSTPTLDSKVRTDNFEGYETVFELRLPRKATVGVTSINLGLLS